jgi:hypothetical protein
MRLDWIHAHLSVSVRIRVENKQKEGDEAGKEGKDRGDVNMTAFANNHHHREPTLLSYFIREISYKRSISNLVFTLRFT